MTDPAYIPCVLVVVYYAASGLKAMGLYNEARYSAWIHPAQTAETACVVALAFLPAGEWRLVVGALLIGNVLFQMGINRAFGRPLIDPGEKAAWDLWGIAIPKALTGSLPGRLRYLQLLIGAALVAWGFVK